MPVETIIIYAVAGIVVIAGYFIRNAFSEKRHKQAVAFSIQEGFSMVPGAGASGGLFGFDGGDDDVPSLLPAPKGQQIETASELVIDLDGCLPRTGDYRAENVLVKHDGTTDWCIFDYTTIYRDSKGNRSESHYGVVCARIPLMLERVELKPENVLYKIGRALGMNEIDFEVEDFNKKYFVSAADRKFAFDLINPKAIEALLKFPARHWQFDGPFVVIIRSGFYDYFDALRAIEEIREVLETVEPFVKEERAITNVRPLMTQAPVDPTRPHNPYTDSGVVQ